MPLGDIRQPFTEEEKGKVLDPNPERRRHVTEVFHKFVSGKVSAAELLGVPKKTLAKLAEIAYLKYKYGRYSEAKEIFEPLATMDGQNFYYHTALGGIYQKEGKSVDAVVEYSRAIRLNPRDVCSYVNRGEIYLRHKNFKKAAEDFRKSILLDSLGKNLWSNRARSLVIALKRSLELRKKARTKALAKSPARPKAIAARRTAPSVSTIQ